MIKEALSPSQIKRNLDRQNEFKRRFVKIENKEAFENIHISETELDTISMETQTNLVHNDEAETQTLAFKPKMRFLNICWN